MNRFWQAFLTLLTVTITSAGSQAIGQDVEVLNQWYSQGVHAYFAGNLRVAEQMLSRAVDAGTQDPRVYYFRAMARLRQGRRADAAADLSLGADLEVRDTQGLYPVGRSLERIQGQQRLIIESHRRRAQTVAFRQRQQRSRLRYESLQRREEDVLRRQITVPLEQVGKTGDAPAVSAPAVSPRQPVPGAAPESPLSEQPQPTAPTAADDEEDIVAVPADEKLEASELGSTLMRIFSRAVSDDTQPADTPDRVPGPPPAMPMPAPPKTAPAETPEDSLDALFDKTPEAEQPADDPAEGFSEEIEGESKSDDNPFLDDPESPKPAEDAPPAADEPSDLDELFSNP